MPSSDCFLHFPQLDFPGLEHVFTLRKADGTAALSCADSLNEVHFPTNGVIEAAQPHGNRIALVSHQDIGKVIPDVDGLITNRTDLTLAIRTADCGPLFLYDPAHQAIGVVHSGKKGTQAGILAEAIQAMGLAYQSDPSCMIVVLGPCIRPPQYDIDFSRMIQQQALESGVIHYTDCGFNTGADLKRFYSYRMEQGQTGRHYAAMRLLGR
jgi:polyphenol oxidase